VTAAAAPNILVVSAQPLDATTTLFFQHVRSRAAGRVRIARYGAADIAAGLSEATALVLVRGLLEFQPLASCARRLRIPVYYFTDDNFIVVRDTGGAAAQFVTRYSAANVRRALRACAGVLLSSPPLIDYFAEHRLHARLILYPPAASGVAPVEHQRPASRLHVAFFGGLHLHDFLDRAILPAVRRVARQRPVTFIVTGVSEPIAASEGLTIVHHPYAASYAEGIARLGADGVDVLVHPVAPGVPNNVFKNPHALISANALGAIPIVSARAPYEGIEAHGVALACGDSEDAWYSALLEAAHQDTAAAIRARLAAYCADRFSGQANLEVIDGILDAHAPPSPRTAAWRRSIAPILLLMGRATGLFARAISPVA
jgi:hypothetical protein